MESRQSYIIRLLVIVAGLIGAIYIINEVTDTDYPIITGSNPVTDTLITNTYPKLYADIFKRDASLLKPYFDHRSEEIRKQAWRAFANTPVQVDSLQGYIDKAIESNSESAWFGISKQELEPAQLRMLEGQWNGNPALRSGISLVLGRQGDRQSLTFLLSKFEEALGSSFESNFSLAVGRLALRFNLANEEKVKVIRQAFESSDVRITRGYLYGFYRGDQKQVASAVRDSLYQHWRVYGVGARSEVDQYVARIIPEKALHEIAIFYNGEKMLERSVQLSIELAQMLGEVELNERTSLDARFLLVHPNPHVVHQALVSLTGRIGPGDGLYRYIQDRIITSSNTDDFVWLQALKALSAENSGIINNYLERLQNISSGNAYLLPEVLTFYYLIESPEAYLERLEGIIGDGNPLRTRFAVQALTSFWNQLDAGRKSDSLIEKTRELAFEALAARDRGVAFATQPLLLKNDLFNEKDFNRIHAFLSDFSLPADIEVYQAFGRLYKQKFEKQARPVIDSLSALGHAPLNRSLAGAGWDVSIPEQPEIEFRNPNWERLWNGIGYNPLWVLVTDKGAIKVRLHLLTAPATISAIDSLTQAGAYNGVPFHRVVPNFVIQGGDVERADGLGGPDFTIPTEGSEVPFNRGNIGIASAGTDTEGSQYFIMHQWKPHLNGNYTVFGEVVEGMNIVDRVAVGDTVRTAYWE